MYELETLEARVLCSANHFGWLLGDADRNGVVNAQDAQIIAEKVVNLSPTSNEDIKRLDLSGDGELTGYDVVLADTLGEGVPLSMPFGVIYPSLQWQWADHEYRKIEFFPASQTNTVDTGYLVGDLNHDHKINVYDSFLMAPYLNGEKTATPGVIKRADLNHNGQIDWNDWSIAFTYVFRNRPLPPVTSL